MEAYCESGLAFDVVVFYVEIIAPDLEYILSKAEQD